MKLALPLLVAAISAGASLQSGGTPAQGTAAPQAPSFRSSVDVTALDVTVVDAAGRPIVNLAPSDFTVRIDGRPRRVVRAEWIPLKKPATTPAPPPPPDGYSSNEGATPGRLIVIAVDQPNIRPDGVLAVRGAINTFIDGLEPVDRLAAVAIGQGVSTEFTSDRALVKDAIARMSGEMRPIADLGTRSLGGAEALEIADGNQEVLQDVVDRECGLPTGARGGRPGGLVCPQQIAAQAMTIASTLKQETDRSLQSLHTLLDGLRRVDAPKTLVLVSEGFALGNQSGAVLSLGQMAAAARTSVYVLKLDGRTSEIASRGTAPGSERNFRTEGVALLATISKGGVLEVTGSGTAALDRLEREISGYYMLGVEFVPGDADGKAHPLNVQVARPGALVRARREVSNAAANAPAGAPNPAPNPIEAVANALASPLVVPGLPLHVTTFSLRDSNPAKIQLLIHADVGDGYTAAKAITLGYAITDRKGAVIVNQLGDGRLVPATSAPSPLVYTVSATVDPGEYMLKLAVTEAGRVGSVEHPVHAGLIDAGALTLSELVIGGPVDARQLMRPTISYDVTGDGVQGYLEAYGNVANLFMRFEVAPTLDAPSLLSAVVPGRAAGAAGDARTVFSYTMPARELPPGPYYLRATLSAGPTGTAGGGPLKKVARAFRVLPTASTPAPAPASSTSSAPAVAPSATPARPFRREDALDATTVARFRESVGQASRKDFDEGVTALQDGDFGKAEQSFKGAIRGAATDSSVAPLAYLGVTYAATGHDPEASSVWQNALIDGYDHAEIYVWLADALVRQRNFDQARSILNEAAQKWPNDTRLTTRQQDLQPAATGGAR